MLLRRIGLGLLFALIGCIVAAIASYFLILEFSSNTHDRSLEASTTSLFFSGPIGAVIGFVAGVALGGRRPGKASNKICGQCDEDFWARLHADGWGCQP